MLWTYKMTHDTGFAPNPFFGVLTLATCKPGIRRTKSKGEWVAGFSAKALVNHARAYNVAIEPGALIWIGKISECIPMNDYFHDSRFAEKKPDLDSEDATRRLGDNAYYKNGNEWKQLPCEHDPEDTGHDVGGVNALIFREFFYLGRSALPLPEKIRAAIPTGPTCYGIIGGNNDDALAITAWLEERFQNQGMIDLPCMFDDKATSSTCGATKPQRKTCGGCGA